MRRRTQRLSRSAQSFGSAGKHLVLNRRRTACRDGDAHPVGSHGIVEVESVVEQQCALPGRQPADAERALGRDVDRLHDVLAGSRHAHVSGWPDRGAVLDDDRALDASGDGHRRWWRRGRRTRPRRPSRWTREHPSRPSPRARKSSPGVAWTRANRKPPMSSVVVVSRRTRSSSRPPSNRTIVMPASG